MHKNLQLTAEIISLFYLTELFARFIFSFFLSNGKKKERKMNRARTLIKKNRPVVFY